ncbi:TonB-dependent Receptor Plug Domain [Ensifer sp. OV372]|nr:TonB-dependent Receptor Plug Domain [Ensifer sp. OV372]
MMKRMGPETETEEQRQGDRWNRCGSAGWSHRFVCACLAGTALTVPTEALAQKAKEKEKATELEQIVVTATGFEQNVKDAPASITVISGEDLQKRSFRDLTDALRDAQGVAVTGVANERDIFIRGLPGSYTLILVDGKRQSTRDARTNGNSGFEQSFIPPAAAIERIEIVRGPMSSLYGSDAMGGVINIITRKVADSWTGSFTTDGTMQQHKQFGNSGQMSFYTSGPILKDTLGVQIWGRGLKRSEDRFLSGITGSKEHDLTARLSYTPNEDHDFFLEGGTARLRRDANVGKTIEPGPRAVSTYNDNDRDHWSFSHTGRWGPTTSDFSILQEWAERRTYNYSHADGRFVKQPRAPEVRNTVIDGKFTTPFDLGGSHTLVTGGQYFEARLSDRTRVDARA